MGDLDKAIERIRRRPPDARFEDVRAVLRAFGWLPRDPKARHVVFKKPGHRSLTVPNNNGKVKRAYLDDICNLLGLDEDTKD
jgi:predicted RNA binding protein YcfA (HicA-like mRNA interferase family)